MTSASSGLFACADVAPQQTIKANVKSRIIQFIIVVLASARSCRGVSLVGRTNGSAVPASGLQSCLIFYPIAGASSLRSLIQPTRIAPLGRVRFRKVLFQSRDHLGVRLPECAFHRYVLADSNFDFSTRIDSMYGTSANSRDAASPYRRASGMIGSWPGTCRNKRWIDGDGNDQ
jgi:hypothetical protein